MARHCRRPGLVLLSGAITFLDPTSVASYAALVWPLWVIIEGMRSSLGKLISLIGWVSIAFLGLVMLFIALGITHFESNEVRGWIVIATGIPTGVVLVVAGKTVRHEGPIWRAKRLRDMQQRDEEWRRKRKEDLLS